uniref:Uncharacterized protein n=1 Tax=Arundo donax TaxID=35708 RepID=A0A0A9A7N4_ARUDO
MSVLIFPKLILHILKKFSPICYTILLLIDLKPFSSIAFHTEGRCSNPHGLLYVEIFEIIFTLVDPYLGTFTFKLREGHNGKSISRESMPVASVMLVIMKRMVPWFTMRLMIMPLKWMLALRCEVSWAFLWRILHLTHSL